MNISDLLYGMITRSSALAMKAPASLLGMIRTRLFDLNHKTKKGWVMIATDAVGEEDNLRNYIDIAVSFTFAFPTKTTK